MRISDWSSDVCSSDLRARGVEADIEATAASLLRQGSARLLQHCLTEGADCPFFDLESHRYHERRHLPYGAADQLTVDRKGRGRLPAATPALVFEQACSRLSLLAILGQEQSLGMRREQPPWLNRRPRSEEHTSELQSLMRISYAVFCLKKKKNKK